MNRLRRELPVVRQGPSIKGLKRCVVHEVHEHFEHFFLIDIVLQWKFPKQSIHQKNSLERHYGS
jgi:hypothetical protein